MQVLKLTFFILLYSGLCYAQQDSLVVTYDDSKLEAKEISEDDLKNYKQDDAFNYVEDVPKDNFIVRAFNAFKNWLGNIIRKIVEAIFGVGKANGLLYFIFNILPYLILAALIFLLIRFFLKVSSKTMITGQQKGAGFQFTEEEHIIKNEDINALIATAIEQKNYRLAIRYYYLMSLKYLTETRMVTWQQEKTNEDYITEIENASVKADFKAITRIYDYVWYGEFNIDELKFQYLKVPFETLNSTLNKQ